MRFNETEYEAFALTLKERGYYRGKDSGSRYADHCWYKHFRSVQDSVDRGYIISLSVYDHADLLEIYSTLERFLVEFTMTMNHQTRMDFERCDWSLIKDAMGVEEFEDYCDHIYDCMLSMLPKRKGEAKEA